MKNVKKPKRTLRKFTKDHFTVITATAAVLLLSAVSVIAVRAYLEAATEDKLNVFDPMTYTNTEINDNLPTSSFEMTRKSNDYHVLQLDTDVSKTAVVHNLDGGDKKPVYVRVAVVPIVRVLNDGVYENITSFCNNFSVTFTAGSDWTQVGDYYYYARVLNPDDSSSSVFADDKIHVTFEINEEVIDPTKVKITVDVVADTIQAVETDSANRDNWTYTNALAVAEWGNTLSNILEVPVSSGTGGGSGTGGTGGAAPEEGEGTGEGTGS